MSNTPTPRAPNYTTARALLEALTELGPHGGDPVPQLHWRLVVGSVLTGEARRVVEQNVCARTDASGLVERLSLLCSGFQGPDYA
jgi:hypothetical protein